MTSAGQSLTARLVAPVFRLGAGAARPYVATGIFLLVGVAALTRAIGWVFAAAAVAWAVTLIARRATCAMSRTVLWRATLVALGVYVLAGGVLVQQVGAVPGATRAFTFGQMLVVTLMTRERRSRADGDVEPPATSMRAIATIVALPSVIFGLLSTEAPVPFEVRVFASTPQVLPAAGAYIDRTPLGADALVRVWQTDGTYDDLVAHGGIATGTLPYGGGALALTVHVTMHCVSADGQEDGYYSDVLSWGHEDGLLALQLRETILRVALGAAYDPTADPLAEPIGLERLVSLSAANSRAEGWFGSGTKCSPVTNDAGAH